LRIDTTVGQPCSLLDELIGDELLVDDGELDELLPELALLSEELLDIEELNELLLSLLVKELSLLDEELSLLDEPGTLLLDDSLEELTGGLLLELELSEELLGDGLLSLELELGMELRLLDDVLPDEVLDPELLGGLLLELESIDEELLAGGELEELPAGLELLLGGDGELEELLPELGLLLGGGGEFDELLLELKLLVGGGGKLELLLLDRLEDVEPAGDELLEVNDEKLLLDMTGISLSVLSPLESQISRAACSSPTRSILIWISCNHRTKRTTAAVFLGVEHWKFATLRPLVEVSGTCVTRHARRGTTGVLAGLSSTE